MLCQAKVQVRETLNAIPLVLCKKKRISTPGPCKRNFYSCVANTIMPSQENSAEDSIVLSFYSVSKRSDAMQCML